MDAEPRLSDVISGVEVPVEGGSGAGVDGPELKEETVDSRFSLILRNMLVDALVG